MEPGFSNLLLYQTPCISVTLQCWRSKVQTDLERAEVSGSSLCAPGQNPLPACCSFLRPPCPLGVILTSLHQQHIFRSLRQPSPLPQMQTLLPPSPPLKDLCGSIELTWISPHLQSLPQNTAPQSYAQDPSRITTTPGRETRGTEEKKQSKSQQLKKVFQEYGAVGVSLHIGISLVSLGVFYMVVSSGVDMSAILLKLGFKESLVQSKMAAGTSTFVVAYAIHKLFAPVRISITLFSVPFIVRYFRRVGLFKPPAAKP
ncbi:protein FAM210B, mitochondrial isoform 1-T1 [Thomomys bottae]